MTESENFSEELYSLRKKHGLNQAELAIAVNLSPSYIHQLETGKRVATDATKMLFRIWDELRTLKAARQAAAADAGQPLHIREEAVNSYSAPPAKTMPFPVTDDALRGRVEKLANQFGITADRIIHSAVSEYVTRAESEGTLTLQARRGHPADESKSRGAA